MKTILTKLTTAVLALAALLITTSAWAATPVAVWDGDFSQDQIIDSNGYKYTITLNGSSISSDETYIQVGATGSGNGPCVSFTDSSGQMVKMQSGMAVIVKFESFTPGTGPQSLIDFYSSTQGSNLKNLVGIAVDASGSLAQIWGAQAYQPTAKPMSIPTDGSEFTLGYTWQDNSTQGSWVVKTGDSSSSYNCGTFQAGPGDNNKFDSVYIGGRNLNDSVFSNNYSGFTKLGQ